jgi:hypothetical protein
MEPGMSLLFLLISIQRLVEAPLFPVFCGVAAFVYLFPWLLAWARHHPQQVPLFLFTLFLGWTGVGWVIALVWSAWHFTPDRPADVVIQAPPRTRRVPRVMRDSLLHVPTYRRERTYNRMM